MLLTICGVSSNNLDAAQIIDIVLSALLLAATIAYVIYTRKILKANEETNKRLDKQIDENHKANDLTRKQLTRKIKDKKNTYKGVLVGIRVELEYHRNRSLKVLSELKPIEDYAKTTGEFNLLQLPYLFETDLLKLTIEKFWDYGNFKLELFQYLVQYINQSELVNTHFNFNAIKEMRKKYALDAYEQIVDSYFRELQLHLETLDKIREDFYTELSKTIDHILSVEQYKKLDEGIKKYMKIKNQSSNTN